MNSLGQISKSFLFQRQLSIHWFVQCLVAASECMRELHLDDIACINTKLLTVDANGAAALPAGFVDVVTVGSPTGQKIRPMVADGTINRLADYTTHGNVGRYTDTTNGLPTTYWGNGNWSWWGWNIQYNSYGEYLSGGVWNNNSYIDGYVILPERNVIQLNEFNDISQIYLVYIGDGMNSDAATRIHSYAYSAIMAYIAWQYDEKGKSGTRGEELYLRQRKILRARRDELTIDYIKRSMALNFNK